MRAWGNGSGFVRVRNLWLRENAWWAREDSNLQPDRYERSALTIELRARNLITAEVYARWLGRERPL